MLRRSDSAKAVALMAALVASGAAAGCTYAMHPRMTIAGHATDWAALETLPAGTTEAAVLAALGPAPEVRTDGDEVVWSYYERAQLRGCTSTKLFITTGRPHVVEYTGHVRLRDGVVTGVSSDQRPSKDRSSARGEQP
jgi:outer membrane protein assembly factor BamE (lipoprotein component of BamABCDE complex)